MRVRLGYVEISNFLSFKISSRHFRNILNTSFRVLSQAIKAVKLCKRGITNFVSLFTVSIHHLVCRLEVFRSFLSALASLDFHRILFLSIWYLLILVRVLDYFLRVSNSNEHFSATLAWMCMATERAWHTHARTRDTCTVCIRPIGCAKDPCIVSHHMSQRFKPISFSYLESRLQIDRSSTTKWQEKLKINPFEVFHDYPFPIIPDRDYAREWTLLLGLLILARKLFRSVKYAENSLPQKENWHFQVHTRPLPPSLIGCFHSITR